jgi:cytochrome c oxidase subunit 2
MAISGEDTIAAYGCSGCHSEAAGAKAPRLEGLYGTEVRLESGEVVLADEAYLRESILLPRAKLVDGYPPIMPEFQGRLTETQLDGLIEYIRRAGE